MTVHILVIMKNSLGGFTKMLSFKFCPVIRSNTGVFFDYILVCIYFLTSVRAPNGNFMEFALIWLLVSIAAMKTFVFFFVGYFFST